MQWGPRSSPVSLPVAWVSQLKVGGQSFSPLQGAAQMHWYSRPVDYYGQMPARVGDVDGEAVVRVLQGSFVAAGAELVLVGDAAALVRQSPDLRDAAVLLPIQVTDGL